VNNILFLIIMRFTLLPGHIIDHVRVGMIPIDTWEDCDASAKAIHPPQYAMCLPGDETVPTAILALENFVPAHSDLFHPADGTASIPACTFMKNTIVPGTNVVDAHVYCSYVPL
jgi:hypothetical protein